MAFPSSISLYPSVGSAVVYDPMGTADANRYVRIAQGSTLVTPVTLSLAHQLVTSKGQEIDRHLVQHVWSKVDAAGKRFDMIANLTLAVPRNVLFTSANVEDQVSLLFSLFRGAGTGLTGNNAIASMLLNQV